MELRRFGKFGFLISLAAAAIAVPHEVNVSDRSPGSPVREVAGEFTISDNVDLVLLNVSVKDSSGHYVTGLRRDDFQVLEDGKPRPLTHFSSIDSPVSVGLVLDNSGSMRSKRSELIMAGLAFASASNPQDEFFVVNFNNRVEYGLPPQLAFTDNLELLQRALRLGQPQGQTALYDGIASALEHLTLSKQEMRTLVVVSDGGDNVSRTRFPEVVQLVEAARVSIYTIGLLDPEDRDLNPGVLRKIASISGGEYFQPETPEAVIPVLCKISKDIRNRYVIGYHPDEVQDKRTLRTVKVKAEENGRRLSVRTRTTYSLSTLKEIETAKVSPQ